MYYLNLIFSTFIQLISIYENKLIFKLISVNIKIENIKPVLYTFSINKYESRYHPQYTVKKINNFFHIGINLKIEEELAIFFFKLFLYENDIMIYSGYISFECFTEKNLFKDQKLKIILFNNPYLKKIYFNDNEIYLRDINENYCTIETLYEGPLLIELYGLKRKKDYFSSAYYISSLNSNIYKIFFTNLKNFPNKKYVFFLLLNDNFIFLNGEKTVDKKSIKIFNSLMNKIF